MQQLKLKGKVACFWFGMMGLQLCWKLNSKISRQAGQETRERLQCMWITIYLYYNTLLLCCRTCSDCNCTVSWCYLFPTWRSSQTCSFWVRSIYLLLLGLFIIALRYGISATNNFLPSFAALRLWLPAAVSAEIRNREHIVFLASGLHVVMI